MKVKKVQKRKKKILRIFKPNVHTEQKKSLLRKRMRPECNIVREIEDEAKMDFDYNAGYKSAKLSPGQLAAEAPDYKKVDQDEPILQKKLRWQIEFYFSDQNLLRDKHMRSLLETNSPNSPYNCVPMQTLTNFNKVKALLGDQDSSVVIKALKPSRLLKITKQGHVKRRIPFKYDSNVRRASHACTVYLQGEMSPEDIARKLKNFSVKYIKVNAAKKYATIELGQEQLVREAVAAHPELLTPE